MLVHLPCPLHSPSHPIHWKNIICSVSVLEIYVHAAIATGDVFLTMISCAPSNSLSSWNILLLSTAPWTRSLCWWACLFVCFLFVHVCCALVYSFVRVCAYIYCLYTCIFICMYVILCAFECVCAYSGSCACLCLCVCLFVCILTCTLAETHLSRSLT